MKRAIVGSAIVFAALIGAMSPPFDAVAQESAKATGTFRVYGLFAPDREVDLRQVMQQLPDIKLVSVSFERGEATFAYDIKKVFGAPTPEQIPERLNNLLRGASHGTFGVKPLSKTSQDKLERLEIAVYGLDCKACSFACYKILEETEGVEYAAASFKEQKAVVLIDPTKTSREALQKRLKEREVSLEPAKVIMVP